MIHFTTIHWLLLIRIGATPCFPVATAPAASVQTLQETNNTQPAWAGQAAAILLPVTEDLRVGVPEYIMRQVDVELEKSKEPRTIILQIASNHPQSGQLTIWLQSLQSKHRVIAWIQVPSLQATCLSLHCTERYLTTDCVERMAKPTSLGICLPDRVENIGKWMILAIPPGANPGESHDTIGTKLLNGADICSYDRDSNTQEPVYRPGLVGDFIFMPNRDEGLEGAKRILLGIKFAKGFVDDAASLAQQLGIAAWPTVDSFGPRLMAEWRTLAKQAENAIPEIIARLQKADKHSKIPIYDELIAWWKKCPDIARTYMPSIDLLEMQRAQCGGR